MDLFGIGGMELAAIIIVALIVLGPGRLVDGLRTAGKYWGQARRLLREIADSATVNISETSDDRRFDSSNRANDREDSGETSDAGDVGSSKGEDADRG